MNPPENIPFEQIVRDTVDLIAGSLNTQNVQLKIQADLPVVRGDRSRLLEIVQNLISNAAKFMGTQPNPTIEIGTRGVDDDGMPIFFVHDNGVGIEPRYHERIFGLFNRLDPSIDGTGIGLTLVKRIVEVHGGRIWVESQPGEGSTFLFTLPLGTIES
jgi:signal transduction histidine kinase